MNVDTGQIYRNLSPDLLKQLIADDPRIVEVSKEVADMVEAGREALTLEMPARTPVERARISWHRKNSQTPLDDV